MPIAPIYHYRKEIAANRRSEIYNGDAKTLCRFYDTAKRIVKDSGLPEKVVVQGKEISFHEVLGFKLYAASREGRLKIVGGSFFGNPKEIVETIRNIISGLNPSFNLENIRVKPFSEKRLLTEQLTHAKWWKRTKAEYYDVVSPIQRLNAFGTLLAIERQKLEEKIENRELKRNLEDSENLRLQLMQGLWAVMKRFMLLSGKTKEDFEKQAEQVYKDIAVYAREGMGMGQNCESLIFRVVGPNGESHLPYMYTIVKKNSSLADRPIQTLKAEGFEKEGDLFLPNSRTPIRIDQDGNKYLTIKEFESFNPRRDYVVVIEGNGDKQLYKKIIRSGDDLIKKYNTQKMKILFAGKPNAYVELVKTSFQDEHLSDGDIIPTVLRGTKLVVAASAGEPGKERETEEKIRTARELQNEIFENAGIVVPLYEHPAEYSFGLVGEVKPFRYYIENGTAMVNSPRPLIYINEALRMAAAGKLALVKGKIMGEAAMKGKIPETFYVGGGFRLNEKGEYCLSTVVEVPSPEVVPENIDPQKLFARFDNGMIYTDLSATAESIISNNIRSETMMRTLIPDFILKSLSAGNLEVIKGSFKNMSIGFIDLKSSTAMCAAFAKKGAAADYAVLISHLLTKLKAEVESQGINVVILKFIGDCIMFVTGLPFGGQTDHGDIIRAGIAMKKAIMKANNDPKIQAIYEKHPDIFRNEKGQLNPARFCTGIMSGEVFAGNILYQDIDYRAFLTGQFLVDYQVVFDLIGDAVNVAARLEAAADAYHLVIDMQTIEGAKREGSLSAIIEEYNAYCTDINSLRDKLLIPYYEKNNLPFNARALNQKLEQYRQAFSPLTLEDLSVPYVCQGKGTDIIRAFYFRWDVRPIVLQRLKAAHITVPPENGETSPPSLSEILERDYATESPDKAVLARLLEYINFVGFDHLRRNAQSIQNEITRERVINNLVSAQSS